MEREERKELLMREIELKEEVQKIKAKLTVIGSKLGEFCFYLKDPQNIVLSNSSFSYPMNQMYSKSAKSFDLKQIEPMFDLPKILDLLNEFNTQNSEWERIKGILNK